MGELAEAEELYKQVLSKFPKNIKAIQGYQKLKAGLTSKGFSSSEPPEEQIQKLEMLYNHGRFKEVLSKVKPLINLFPKIKILYYFQGAANLAIQNFDASVYSYKQIVKIDPNYAEAHNNIGVAMEGKGSLESAIDSYKQAVKIKPDYSEAHFNLGNVLHKKGSLDAALDSYSQAVKIKSNHAEAHHNIGVIMLKKYAFGEAIESYKQAVKIKPNYAEAYNNMGSALEGNGDIGAAIESCKHALRIKPNYAEAHNNMGSILEGIGELGEAIESYKQALKSKPDYAEAHLNLSALKNYKYVDEQVLQMRSLYADQKLGLVRRSNICFALAKVSEDLNNFKEAFNYLKEGNTLRKKALSYDIRIDQFLFDSLKKTDLTLPQSVCISTQNNAEVIPIFILGMPRSGTTLVEQIVSSHSKVTGAGELSYFHQLGHEMAKGEQKIDEINLLSLRKQYLSKIVKLANGKKFVTDKMPHNFHYINLICRAFPEAKIIHVKRNSAAICWSNYKKYFATNGLGYSYNLSDLVKYYHMYADLMQFWNKRYSDRIYHLDYDKLTLQQEYETKRLITQLELDWQEACLSPQKNKRSVKTASNQQIRQKVYKTSSQQWRKFETFLDGEFDNLNI